MALLHRAELRPTKLDLLAAWLPAQPWYDAPPGTGVERVAAYRFDDPANAVGIETLLVRAGDGVLYQVPLTYRAAPLADGEAWLVGTAEHSVLGRRWVYDGCGDPVYRTALTGAVAGEVPQADEYIEIDGELIMRERSMTVTRSEPAATHDWRESDRDGLCVGIGGGVAGAVRWRWWRWWRAISGARAEVWYVTRIVAGLRRTHRRPPSRRPPRPARRRAGRHLERAAGPAAIGVRLPGLTATAPVSELSRAAGLGRA